MIKEKGQTDYYINVLQETQKNEPEAPEADLKYIFVFRICLFFICGIAVVCKTDHATYATVYDAGS